MSVFMGGTPSKLQFCRTNVLCVVNLTHAEGNVQFSFVQNLPGVGCLATLWPKRRQAGALQEDARLNRIGSNNLSALTPPRSAAIISVSVRSAELRLVLYV